jgi:hypothetical protein
LNWDSVFASSRKQRHVLLKSWKITEKRIRKLEFVRIWMFTAGATGQQGMLTLPRHLIPPPVYPGVRVRPYTSLTCNSCLCFETDHSLVS